MDLCRNPASATIAVGDTLGESVGFPLHTFSGAIIHVPSSEVTLTGLDVYVGDSEDSGGTYRRLKDYTGVPVTLPVAAGEAIELHPAAFAAPFIKLVANATSASPTVNFPITPKG